MQGVYAIAAAFGSFLLCDILTNPKSRVKKRIPVLKIKRIELVPSIKITTSKKVIHIHHWLHMSALLVVITIFVQDGFLSSWATKGALLGGVFQGIRFPDRGIIHSRE